MAKKKADPQTESNSDKAQDTVHDNQTMDEPDSVKLHKLKLLNARLLKETVDRRQQVDSLLKSNKHLHSELEGSMMDNGLLKSELNGLTEKAVMLEIEKGLASVFVIGQANQLAEEKFESLKGRIVGLEGEMERVLEEKSEIEKARSEKESEIRDLKSRLDELTANINQERVVSSRVCDERDGIRAQLDARTEEVNELQLQQNTVHMQLIDSITSEKDLIQANLVESNAQIDDLKKNVEALLEQKKAVEDENNTHERKNEELQTTVSELKDFIETIKNDEKGLLEKLTDLENKFAASSENEAALKNEINGLVEKNKETDERIKGLEKEKSLVQKDLQEAMKERDFQKLTNEQIVQEKTEIEDAKIQGETEIIKMKEQLTVFQDTISSLKNSCTNQNDKVQQLEDQVSHYKALFDQATTEKDEALKSLQEQEAIKTDFQHKITAMEKEIQDLHEDLAKITTENSKNIAEKNELEDRCSELTKYVAVLEAKLEETRVESDETKSKLGLAEANSSRVLKILKRTLSGSNETRDLDNGNGDEEVIKDHVTEVEEIKRVFKEKESRVEEMKRQLELVTNSAAEVRKEKSFWALVSSATTLLAAAVSVAYVARAN